MAIALSGATLSYSPLSPKARRRMAALLPTALLALALALSVAPTARGEQMYTWGHSRTRNMVSEETGLPGKVDIEAGTNVKWVVPLGTQTYATPIGGGGRVYIGTNNENPRDPRLKGDRGVLFCLDSATGDLVWQLAVPKIPGDPYKDWNEAGLCSPPTIAGDRVYIVTNRAEVVSLDPQGMANGNTGPFVDESALLAQPGEPPIEIGPLDGDVIWHYDMIAQAGIYPHDSAHSSILLDGDYLYLNTGNGVDNTHAVIRSPEAPSLIVLDRRDGRLVAQDVEKIGDRIFHATWSSPAMATVEGQSQIIFGGADGVLYGFRKPTFAEDAPLPLGLEKIWWFDCDPTAPKENVHEYLRNREVSPSIIKGMPVVHGDSVYLTVGGDIWWGKRQSWLKRVALGGEGDVTASAEKWSYEMPSHSCTTPAVIDGLVFAADNDGNLNCVDAETGKAHWVHRFRGEIWGSPLVADGKLYIGTRRRVFAILEASETLNILTEIELDSPINGSATASEGTVYVASMRNLYAFAVAP